MSRDENRPDCADVCEGFVDSNGTCVDGCDHLVQNFDVERDDVYPES